MATKSAKGTTDNQKSSGRKSTRSPLKSKRKSASTKVSKPRASNANKPKGLKHPSGLDLAAEVLAKSDTPLNAKAVAERVIAAGWQTDGKTPAATLSSAIQREIAKKGKEARFKKVGRGQFAINKQGNAK